MERQPFLWLLSHELVNDIPKSLRSGQQVIGRTLSKHLLSNMLPMGRRFAS
jgi:hypothetical protein